MQAVVKRKNKKDWVFNWDGQNYSLTTHYGNKYRLSLTDGVKIEALHGNTWRHDWKINDTVRPTQVVFSI
jgi:hypothetical protein